MNTIAETTAMYFFIKIQYSLGFFAFTKTLDCYLNTRNNYIVFDFSNIEFLFTLFELSTPIRATKVDCTMFKYKKNVKYPPFNDRKIS